MANPFLSGVLKAGQVVGSGLEQAGGAVARSAANVATLGTYEHPDASVAYLRSLPSMFDPRTRAGAANLASIFMGKMTPPQAGLLAAIHNSTFGEPGAHVFDPLLPSSKELVAKIGQPSSDLRYRAPLNSGPRGFEAMNPMVHLLTNNPGRTLPQVNPMVPHVGWFEAKSRLGITGHGDALPPHQANLEAARMWPDAHPQQLAALVEILQKYRRN